MEDGLKRLDEFDTCACVVFSPTFILKKKHYKINHQKKLKKKK